MQYENKQSLEQIEMLCFERFQGGFRQHSSTSPKEQQQAFF